MAEIRCDRCRGTGYASAARDSGTEDAPMMHVQYGIYRCPSCNGTGRVGFSDEADSLLKKAIARLFVNKKI